MIIEKNELSLHFSSQFDLDSILEINKFSEELFLIPNDQLLVKTLQWIVAGWY